VLVVDDHPEFLREVAVVLGHEGADVVLAARGDEALELARDGFDVALVDVVLPDRRGTSLVSELQQIAAASAEVVLLTGSGSLDDAIAAVGLDAFSYLLKPVDPERLVAVLGQAFERVGLLRRTRLFERRLRVAEKLLAIGTLSAGLARELSQSVAGLGAQLRSLDGLVRRELEDFSLLGPIAAAQHEMDRLTDFSNALLTFAAPDVPQHRDVDAKGLVERVVALLAPIAEDRCVEIVVGTPGTSLELRADETKLEQVLFNVIRNAIEALADSGGRVEVELRVGEGDSLVVEIRDDGPGIPEPIRERVFEPFFTTHPMGLGLGLAISHSLVEQHGGTIDLASSVAGTMVELRLPRG
jgi:signal transduction histidine kinase